MHCVQVAPCIGPLDRELVKLILRMLKSATFQGTAPLLAAIASTDADTHAPIGLLKVCSSGLLYCFTAWMLPASDSPACFLAHIISTVCQFCRMHMSGVFMARKRIANG
jgi:hypothetical protein